MYTKRAFMSARAVLGAAAVAGTLFAGRVAAQDPVAVAVNTEGVREVLGMAVKLSRPLFTYYSGRARLSAALGRPR
jgi:hypothetical protein